MKPSSSEGYIYSLKSWLTIIGLAAGYLMLSHFLIGSKSDQFILSALFCICFMAGISSRKFIIGFSIFIVYWILFDYMKAFPNYDYNPVHIVQLHGAEKAIFGIRHNGQLLTPNEFWLQHTHPFLDVLSGLLYLCWIPVPLAFAGWLFFADKKMFLEFAFTFVFVNMIGFIIYYIYPAAPPWYIQEHGTHFILNTRASSAGLQRFDDFFQVGIFKGIYQKSSNVFAAMPSLHSSYPLIVLYYGLRKKIGWLNYVFTFIMVGIWFSAVYSSHHYLLDVIAGASCATVGILFFQRGLLRMPAFKQFMAYYQSKI